MKINKKPISIFKKETMQAASIIKKQLQAKDNSLFLLVKKLKQNSPWYVCTIGRGSSDYAAYFLKYAVEINLQLVTSSLSPSVISLYKSNLILKNSLVICISQSGKSYDIIACMTYAKKTGATTLSFINEEQSPLSLVSEYNIPLLAGKEKSVASSKSFIASLARIIQFVSLWNDDKRLFNCLNLLPLALRKSKKYTYDAAVKKLKNTKSILIIGRGYAFPIALESALKLKETCSIHAEAFSGAEVLHGPVEIINKNYPVFVYLINDESLIGMIELVNNLIAKKAKVFLMATHDIICTKECQNLEVEELLPVSPSIHPLCDAVNLIHGFYLFVSELSYACHKNPDKPTHLKKVTKTM